MTLHEAAREFYQTKIDPNADDPMMCRYLAQFASVQIAIATNDDQERIRELHSIATDAIKMLEQSVHVTTPPSAAASIASIAVHLSQRLSKLSEGE